MRDSEKWHREFGDVEDNANSTPPVDERIEWVGFWMAELFAPSHASALIEGLDRLSGRNHSLFRTDDPGDWVKSARTWTGGFINVGFFAQPGTFVTGAAPAGLPSEFYFANLEVRQLAPGVSVLLAQFAIHEKHRACLDVIARTDVASKASPLKGRSGHSIIGPEHVKQDAIATKRRELRKKATDWLGTYVPGYFLSDDATKIPTWDFLTTESCSLIADKEDRSRWRDTFGFGWGDLSEADELPGVELVLTRGRERSRAVDSFVTTRSDADQILANDPHHGAGMSAFLQNMNRSVSDLLPLWTLERALRAYEARFGAIRDELSSPPRWFKRPLWLRAVRGTVLPLAFDLETLRDASQNEIALAMPLRHTSVEFSSPKPPFRPKEKDDASTLMEILRERIKGQGETVSAQARSITSGLKVQTDLLVASSNIRLQWAVIFVTIVLSTVSLYVTMTHDTVASIPRAPTAPKSVEVSVPTGPTGPLQQKTKSHHSSRRE